MQFHCTRIKMCNKNMTLREMIRFSFNIFKATQAASYLLSLNNDKLNYTKLIKLLFIADRRAIEKWNNVITTDTHFIMDCGQVGTNVYNEIKNENELKSDDYWHQFIEKDYFAVRLVKNPGTDLLSKREMDELASVDREFKKYSYGRMIDYCHNHFSEWHDPKGCSEYLPIETIIEHIYKNAKDKENALENLSLAAKSQNSRSALFL